IWVNNAMVTVIGPVAELDPDEVRRVTEVTYLGTVNGTLAALGRMRARDRAAGAVLRREVRDPRFHRRAAQRAPARAQQRARDHGADARAQHAAVRLVPHADAAHAAAGAPGVPARGRGARDRLGRPSSPPRALRRRTDGEGDLGQQARPRIARPLPRAVRVYVADVAGAGRAGSPGQPV